MLLADAFFAVVFADRAEAAIPLDDLAPEVGNICNGVFIKCSLLGGKFAGL